MNLFTIFLIALLLLQVFTEAMDIDDSVHSLSRMDEGANGEALHEKIKPKKINCGHACSRRCSKASRKNRCKRACKSCCARCNCVPPGTYGNKEVCPCYASLKTRGNKLKCP